MAGLIDAAEAIFCPNARCASRPGIAIAQKTKVWPHLFNGKFPLISEYIPQICLSVRANAIPLSFQTLMRGLATVYAISVSKLTAT